jgi:outer membrane protein assembly factor BamB
VESSNSVVWETIQHLLRYTNESASLTNSSTDFPDTRLRLRWWTRIPTETNLPLRWSSTKNVAWKMPIPGQSSSSPIVWADRVFLATVADNGVSCRVLCLDRVTGSVLWNKEVIRQTTAGHKEGRNTYATSTPVTDGKLVLAVFLDGSFAALNFAGDVAWTNRSYPFYS